MPTVTAIPIVILCGQSNANNTDIVSATFSRVAAAGGLLVQSAVNGSALSGRLGQDGSNWSANGAEGQGKLLADLIAQVSAIIDPASPSYVPGAYVESVIWIHGGADIFSNRAAKEYQANLIALNQAMTLAFGSHDLVISGMADASYDHRDLSPGLARNWHRVHAAQEAVAQSSDRIHLIDPDTVAQQVGATAAQMFGHDYIHYSNRAGFATALGNALSAAALPLNTFSSSAAQDHIYQAGTRSDDTFRWQGTGFMQVYASNGTDTLSVKSTGQNMHLTTSGHNDLRIVTVNDDGATLVDAISIERVWLGNGHDLVEMGANLHWVNSGDGRDTVLGSADADEIILGNGSDYGLGGAGNDLIAGRAGNDRLRGGSGDDTLEGGTGNNRLEGGSGADHFVFEIRPGNDTVVDYQDGIDKLVIPGHRWSDLSIHYAAGVAYVDIDDRHIVLLGQSAGSLTASDFIFT